MAQINMEVYDNKASRKQNCQTLEFFSRIRVKKKTWAMLTVTLCKQDVYMFKIIDNKPHLEICVQVYYESEYYDVSYLYVRIPSLKHTF